MKRNVNKTKSVKMYGNFIKKKIFFYKGKKINNKIRKHYLANWD